MVSTRALETAYLYEFRTFLVLRVWGPFLSFFGVQQKYPPGCVVPGRAGFGIRGNARTGTNRNEPEPAEPDLEPEPAELELAHVGTEPNRTEPNQNCHGRN